MDAKFDIPAAPVRHFVSRDVRFGVGQVDIKWDKVETFQGQFSENLILKCPLFFPSGANLSVSGYPSDIPACRAKR